MHRSQMFLKTMAASMPCFSSRPITLVCCLLLLFCSYESVKYIIGVTNCCPHCISYDFLAPVRKKNNTKRWNDNTGGGAAAGQEAPQDFAASSFSLVCCFITKEMNPDSKKKNFVPPSQATLLS